MDRQTDRQTDRQMQTDFIICPIAICYSMGQINNENNELCVITAVLKDTL